MGLWLGIWAWCFVGSLALGFLVGAAITAHLNPAWGFYIMVIILAVFLVVNVAAPETRRAAHRRSILHYFDEEERLKKKVARGEIKLHLEAEGPAYWWEEVWAGIKLMVHMLLQPGFCVLALYLAWVYALVVLVTLVSFRTSSLLLFAYLYPASRCFAFDRLQLEATIRRIGGFCSRNRRSACSAVDKSQLVFKRSHRATTNRQHDIPTTSHMVFSPSQTLSLYLCTSNRWCSLGLDCTWTFSQLDSTNSLEWHSRLSFNFGHCRMYRTHDGGIRYLRPTTRRQFEAPPAEPRERDSSPQNKLLFLPSSGSRNLCRTGHRLLPRRSRNRCQWPHHPTNRCTGCDWCGSWHFAVRYDSVIARALAFQDYSGHPGSCAGYEKGQQRMECW